MSRRVLIIDEFQDRERLAGATHGGAMTVQPVAEQWRTAPAGHSMVQPPPAQLPIEQVL